MKITTPFYFFNICFIRKMVNDCDRLHEASSMQNGWEITRSTDNKKRNCLSHKWNIIAQCIYEWFKITTFSMLLLFPAMLLMQGAWHCLQGTQLCRKKIVQINFAQTSICTQVRVSLACVLFTCVSRALRRVLESLLTRAPFINNFASAKYTLASLCRFPCRVVTHFNGVVWSLGRIIESSLLRAWFTNTIAFSKATLASSYSIKFCVVRNFSSNDPAKIKYMNSLALLYAHTHLTRIRVWVLRAPRSFIRVCSFFCFKGTVLAYTEGKQYDTRYNPNIVSYCCDRV